METANQPEFDREHEANVEFIVISGNTETDEQVDALCDMIRHSLRTQFGVKKVTISIEETIEPLKDNGTCYY
jgi:hypothetical protein